MALGILFATDRECDIAYCIPWKTTILLSTLCPKKSAPPPQVKYSNNHKTEQKSLKITENILTSIWTLYAKLQLSSVSGSWYHTKNTIFHNKTISVKSNKQSAKQSWLQMVFKISTVSVHTFSQYATDNHAVVIN